MFAEFKLLLSPTAPIKRMGTKGIPNKSGMLSCKCMFVRRVSCNLVPATSPMQHSPCYTQTSSLPNRSGNIAPATPLMEYRSCSIALQSNMKHQSKKSHSCRQGTPQIKAIWTKAIRNKSQPRHANLCFIYVYTNNSQQIYNLLILICWKNVSLLAATPPNYILRRLQDILNRSQTHLSFAV